MKREENSQSGCEVSFLCAGFVADYYIFQQIETYRERFEPRNHFISRLSVIILVNIAHTAVYLRNVLPSVFFVGMSLCVLPIVNETKVLIWDSDQKKISFYKFCTCG